MFAKEKRELGDPGGTGGKTARLVPQAPGLENKPRLSDLLLGDAEKKADSILAQLRRSREQEVARAKAMARADAARRPGGPGGTGITARRNQVSAPREKATEQEVKAVSEAARKYIDSLDTPQGKLGNAPAAPKIAPDKNSLYRKVDAVLAAKKQRQESEDIYAQMQKQQMGGAEPEKKVYDRKQYSTPKQAYDYVNTLGAGGTSYTNISMDLAHDTNEALTEYCNNITSAGLTPKIPFIIKFSDVLVDAEEKKINQRTGQNLSLQAFYNKAWLVLRSSFNPTKMQAEAVLNHNNREASTANSHHDFSHYHPKVKRIFTTCS